MPPANPITALPQAWVPQDGHHAIRMVTTHANSSLVMQTPKESLRFQKYLVDCRSSAR